MAKFKQEVLDKIKSDPDLFALVSKALKLKPTSLPVTLDRNSNNLNQYSIVVMVADHLGLKPEDVIEQESNEEVSQAR